MRRTCGAPYPARVRRLTRRVARDLVALAVAIATSSGCAGSDTPIPDATTCDGCVLRLERIARLGSADDPASYGLFATVTRDTRGRFFVAPADDAGEILVYGPDGRFRRILGRTGGGPGEFSPGIMRVDVGPADTLFILDQSQARITTFTPELEFVSTRLLPVPQPTDFWYVGDGEVFIQGWGSRETVAGVTHQRAFHFHSLNDESTRPVGPTWFGEVPMHYVPEIATRPAPSREFYTIRRRSLSLTAWSDGDAPVRRLERDAPWFPADTSTFLEFENPWTTRPIPFIQGLTTHGQEHLVVLIDVADEEWQPTGLATEAIPLTPGNADFNGTFDTLIEVIRPRDRTLVHRERVDQALRIVRTPGPGLLLFSLEVEDGIPVVDIWEGQLIEEHQATTTGGEP